MPKSTQWSFRFSLLCIFTASLQTTALDVARRSGSWTLEQRGSTGVSAMQLVVTSHRTVVVLDKFEQNPLSVNGHPAWVSEVDLETLHVRPLNAITNTWCATGNFLANGTLVSTGGHPQELEGGIAANGLQAIRLFTPCTESTCDLYEDTNALASKRWYPSSVRLQDGSIIIYGGSTDSGFRNTPELNNPTYEFFPPKTIHGYVRTPIPSRFLNDTLNANHYPIMFLLPDGTIFVAANQEAMILDWQKNTETRLPSIPNGVRITSPFSAGAVLLPLSKENNYTPEVLICGGSTLSDAVLPITISSQSPASAQCSRMVLNHAGIAAGWQVEWMPQPRIFPELILLPDHTVLIVNGAQTGAAGFEDVRDTVGMSNADHPAFKAVLYDPYAKPGHRFWSRGIPASNIARMYHSTATLTPLGSVLLAGSNPNEDNTPDAIYPTEYRMEFLTPPYMKCARPRVEGVPERIVYSQWFSVDIHLPRGVGKVTVSLIDLGFATHGVHMDQRLVKLEARLSADCKHLAIQAPPSSTIYPPGPAFVYVVAEDGAVSYGHRVLVGNASY